VYNYENHKKKKKCGRRVLNGMIMQEQFRMLESE
jgi:hypothetical protein